jgi:hypothetical protein
LTVKCSDFLFLLSRRILFSSDYDAVSEGVDDTLANILAIINGANDTGLTLNPDGLLTTAVSKEYSRGDDMAKIIKDLAVATEAEFAIRGRMLEFKETIGADRTALGSPEYLSFRYDVNNPNENSILSASVVQDSKEFANAVLGKSGSSYSGATDAASILQNGRIETAQNFSETSAGALGSQTSQFLALHKNRLFFPKITPRTKGLYFKDIDVGDLVPIYINTGNELFSFNSNYKIVGVSLKKISNAQPIIDLDFSENAISDTDFLEDFQRLKSEVKNLTLKS